MQIRSGRGGNGANPVSSRATRISKPPPYALRSPVSSLRDLRPGRGHCLGTKVHGEICGKLDLPPPNGAAYVHESCRENVLEKRLPTVFMTRDQMELFVPGNLKS